MRYWKPWRRSLMLLAGAIEMLHNLMARTLFRALEQERDGASWVWLWVRVVNAVDSAHDAIMC